VSERINAKFRGWHKEWSEQKLTEELQRSCSDWLFGRIDNVKPHRTKVLTIHDLKRPPYSPYNRYKVDWPSSGPASAASSAAPSPSAPDAR
jgi:paired amphipathic helix protein Sin3a